MKKTIKKAVSLLCIAALMLSFAVTPSFAKLSVTVDNLAMSATAGDNRDEWNGPPQSNRPVTNINDNRYDSRDHAWGGDETHSLADDVKHFGEWNVWLEWETVQTFTNVSIYWEDCYGKSFTLRTSDNGTDWTTIYTGGATRAGWQSIDLDKSYTAKYLGVFITEKATTYGVTIYELQVYNYGNADGNVLRGSRAVWNVDRVAYANKLNLNTLTDGERKKIDSTQWQSNTNAVGEHFYIVLNDVSDFNSVVMFTQNEHEDYKIEYITEDLSSLEFPTEAINQENLSDDDKNVMRELYSALDQKTWIDANATREYSLKNSSYNTYYQQYECEAQGATAIKISTAQGSWAAVYEVEAYFDKTGASTLQEPTEYKNAEGTERFFVAAIDKSFEGKTIVAKYTIKVDGEAKIENREKAISYAYPMIKLGDIEITSANLYAGHSGDYVTGIYFTDIPENCTIDVEFIVK